MSLIDFILNVAGLILWVNWRAQRHDPLAVATPSTLAGTLRRAGRPHFGDRWRLPAALLGLLLLRAIFYWLIGGAVGWTANLDVGVISVPFRSDRFDLMLLYSTLSFGVGLMVLFLWLILLSVLKPATSGMDSLRGLLRIQLGRVDHWPAAIKLLLPLFAGAALWWPASWLLTWRGILPPCSSLAQRTHQALLVGAGGYLAWKFLVGGALALNLIGSYVYFGRHPFWQQLDEITRRLLAPLRRLPLRAGRVDLAPVLGMVLVFLIAHLIETGVKTPPRTGRDGRPLPPLVAIPGLVEWYQRVSK